MKLPTDNGQLSFEEAEGKCVGCRRLGGGMAEMEIEVNILEGVAGVLGPWKLCGQCVATALQEFLEGKLGDLAGKT